MVKFRFISDPGHGWLEVPRATVEASGFTPSSYSYYDPKTELVYLEEDCDAPGYLKAAGIDYPEFMDVYQTPTFVRDLPKYVDRAECTEATTCLTSNRWECEENNAN
jgi:hypothetical protein